MPAAHSQETSKFAFALALTGARAFILIIAILAVLGILALLLTLRLLVAYAESIFSGLGSGGIPEATVVTGELDESADVLIRARTPGAGVVTKQTRLDDGANLGEVLAVADVVVASTSVAQQALLVAVLSATGH